MDQNMQVIALSHLSHTCKCFVILYFLPICCVNSLIMLIGLSGVNSVCNDSLSTGAWSIQQKFPDISVQNSMDLFDPTRKVLKRQNVDHFSWSDNCLIDKWPFHWTILTHFLFPVHHGSVHPGSVYPAVMGRKGCNITSLFREGNMFSVLISCFVYPMMVI